MYAIGSTVIANVNQDAWRSDERGVSITRMNRFVGRIVNWTKTNTGENVYKLLCVGARRRADVGRVFEAVPECSVNPYEYEPGDVVEFRVLGDTWERGYVVSAPRWYNSNTAFRIHITDSLAEKYGFVGREINIFPDDVRLAEHGSGLNNEELGIEELGGFHLWDRVKVTRGCVEAYGYIFAFRTYDRYNPVRVLTDDEAPGILSSDSSDGVPGRYVIRTSVEHISLSDEPVHNAKMKVGMTIGAYSESNGKYLLTRHFNFRGVVTKLLPMGMVEVECTGNSESKAIGRKYIVKASQYAIIRDVGEERDRIICMHCGHAFDDKYRDPDDPDRLDSKYEGEVYELVDDEYVCIDCIESDYAKCHYCRNWELRDNMRWGEYLNAYVCESCCEDNLSWCDRCEDYVPNTHEVIIDDDGNTEYWCDSCIDNNATWCDNCDTYYSDDFSCCPNCGEGGNGDGIDCTGDSSPNRGCRGINNYSFKPHPCFQHMKDEELKVENTLFYGVEDETDSVDGEGDPDDFARALYDACLPLYCKHDGSLDNGAEVVTHPATLRFHLESDMWEKVCNIARENGMRSHDTTTCGLHVHISRKPFIEASIADYEEKLMFAYDHFMAQWKKIARRNNTERWAAFLSERCGSPTKDLEDAKKKKSSYDRYQAVNLANSATVEIRIFRGSLKVETIKATLWLVDAVNRFILDDNNDVMKCSFKELIDYDNAPDFVKEYLKARNVFTD